MSWRFSTASYQEASTGLGGRNHTNRASTEVFLFKKLHQSGVKKEKFGLVLRVLLDFAYPKFPSGFVSRAARRSRSGMENHHWRCGCKVLQKWFHQVIYFEIKRKTKVRKKIALTSWFQPQIIYFEGIKKKPSYCSKALPMDGVRILPSAFHDLAPMSWPNLTGTQAA